MADSVCPRCKQSNPLTEVTYKHPSGQQLKCCGDCARFLVRAREIGGRWRNNHRDEYRKRAIAGSKRRRDKINAYRKMKRQAAAEERERNKPPVFTPLYKTCKYCPGEKHLREFHFCKTNLDGHMSCCKKCHTKRNQSWREKNPERTKQLRRYNENNRRAAMLQRTPTWSNLEAIEQVYEQCPQGMEVDHIVPLQGKLVSGLHVPWNLRYLSGSDNRKKRNKLLPECAGINFGLL